MVNLNEKLGKDYIAAVVLQKHGHDKKETVRLELVEIKKCISPTLQIVDRLQEKEKELFPGYTVKDIRLVEIEEANRIKKFTLNKDFFNDPWAKKKIIDIPDSSLINQELTPNAYNYFLICVVVWNEKDKNPLVYITDLIAKYNEEAMLEAGRRSAHIFNQKWEPLMYHIQVIQPSA